MAPSSIRSTAAAKSAFEIKKKIRRLQYLLKELENDAALFQTKYRRIHKKITTCIDNANARCFVEDLDSVAEVLEEGLQKLSECIIVFTIEDDTDEFEFNADSTCSPSSSANCILDQSIPEKQGEDCDSDRSQCTVLIPTPVKIPIAEICESKESDSDKVTVDEVAEKETVEEWVTDQNTDVVDSQHEAPPLVEVQEVESCEPVEEEKGGPLEGLVTHYVNPSEFYVIVDEDLLFADDLGLELCIENGERKTCAKVPEIGEMFAYFNDGQQEWMRVKILSIEDGNSVKAKYVDYGSDITVKVEQLVEIPEQLVDVPVLASRCSLYNVIPADKEWTKDCIEEMRSMVLQSLGVYATFRVHGEQGLLIDLIKNCKCDGQVVKVNVGDYLVYRGMARYADVNTKPPIPPLKQVSFKINSRPTVKPAGYLSESECSEYDSYGEGPQTASVDKKKEVEDVQEVAIKKDERKVDELKNPNPCVSNGDVGRREDPKKGVGTMNRSRERVRGLTNVVECKVVSNSELLLVFEEETFGSLDAIGSSEGSLSDISGDSTVKGNNNCQIPAAGLSKFHSSNWKEVTS